MRIGDRQPGSLILSAAIRLDWRGRRDNNPSLITAAPDIEESVGAVQADPFTRIGYIGATLGTREFADEVITSLAPLWS